MKIEKINLMENIFLVVFFFTFSQNFAQTDSKEIEICIREKVGDFFKEKDKLNRKEESENSTHILEIVEKTILGYNKVGVYFCSNAPSRQKYFLLKKENKFKILTSKDSLEVMREIVSFLKENKITEGKVIEYLEETNKILRENMSKPFEKRLKEQKWIKCN